MADNSMIAALRGAGFVGIEQGADGLIYARSAPHLPEFTAIHDGDDWRFSMQWPLRASDAQCAQWNALHPDAPLDVDLGETRMQFVGGLDGLDLWRSLIEQMVLACTQWRRRTRQMDEGM